MPLTIEFSVRSDKGLVRENNEDAVHAAAHLLAVADGVGGHVGGEVASAVVVSRLRRLAPVGGRRTPVGGRRDPRATLRQAVWDGNLAIAQRIASSPELRGMGTTLTAVLLVPDLGRIVVANVGDSRTYLLRSGDLVPLTRDDSLVQDLIDRGDITAEQAAVHPLRAVVTGVLMGDERAEPAMTCLNTAPGDRLLLCSDGLTDLVPEAAVAAALRIADREVAADRLVALALAAGGRDHVSVIVGDVVPAAAPPRPAGARRARKAALLVAAVAVLLGVWTGVAALLR
jgi:serine/threonine protein phosphatase PrpC